MLDGTLYLTFTVGPTGQVDIACSMPQLASVAEKTGLHAMVWDVLAFAALKGCRVGGHVAPGRVNPVLLVGLARAALDPEQFGFAVSAEVRDAARRALGLPAVEVAPRAVSVATPAERVTDWSAA